MPRKAKNKVHPMPPLGKQDLLLYNCGQMACLILSLGNLLGLLWLPDFLAFTDDDQVAYDIHAFFWLFLTVPFFFVMFLPIRSLKKKRFPVFGNPDIQYGPPAWPRGEYPLLMKDAPRSDTAKKNLQRWGAVALLLSSLAVFFIVTIYWMFHGFYYLNEDSSITVCDNWGQEAMVYTADEIDEVVFQIDPPTGRRGSFRDWDLYVILKTSDGNRFSFSCDNFRDVEPGHADWIEMMLAVKERFPGKVYFNREDRLDGFASDRYLDEAEIGLLYELFS